ncbi:sensor histidine kinase [Spirosoma koreense]
MDILSFQPTAESLRLEALASYDILDTVPEEDYDAITQIAAHICQTPISLITLLDDHRQWFKSVQGLAIRETARELAFCHYAIQTPERMMEVSDAHSDERFATNPLVLGDPHVVFYAGVPLVDGEGQALGTLCVIDHEVRQLSPEQATVLKTLARQVVTQLQLRRSQGQLERAGQALKQLNSELWESNQMLKTVVDTCPIGLVFWQAVREQEVIVDFRYVFTNPVDVAQTSFSRDQMTGQLLKSLFPEVVVQGFFDRLVDVLRTGKIQRFQYQRSQSEQTIVWNDVMLTPCGDGVLFTTQDITQLKATEKQLRTYSDELNRLVSERTAEVYQLSALQQAILHHAGMAIISTDKEGRIRTFNPAAEQLLGYRSDELIGQNDPAAWSDVYKPDGQTHEGIVETKDGRHIPVLLTRTALRDEAGAVTGYVSMATDITQQKEIEQVLQHSLQREQELNKLKSRFVTTASHEFRTPLATIQSSVELIRVYMERVESESQPAIERHLGIIEKQVANFSSLLSDVLTIGKIEAGRVNYNPRWVDVVELVTDLIGTHYSERQDGRRVEMQVVGSPRRVQLDAQLIAHVLINLLSNAFKFSADDPELSLTFGECQLVIRVTDNGIGIPKAEQAQLFDSFFRASNAADVQGSGLGLGIARQFAMLHGGQIDVQSEEHVGTTCTLTLPG